MAQGQRSAGRQIGLVLAAIALVTLLGSGAAWWLAERARQASADLTDQQDQATATLTQHLADLDTQKALTQARAERDYRAERAKTEAIAQGDRRQAELSRLEAEHRYRLGAIDRLFELIRNGYSQGEVNAITAEFRRLLDAPDGGIDPALAYLQAQEPTLLTQARQLIERRDELQRQARAALRSLLIGAAGAAAEGRPEEAARLYDQALGTDPDWPEALGQAGWFFADRTVVERDHGTLAAALHLARKALDLAERLNGRPPASEDRQRLAATAQLALADILALRGLPGDADQALVHYRGCHDLLERLLAANPDSAQAARDLMVSFERMSKAMAATEGEDAPVVALDHQTKALEIAKRLHEQNPDSAYYARTVAVSYLLTAQRAEAAGDTALAATALAGCYATLHGAIEAGMTFDAPIMRLYERLRSAGAGD